MQVWASSGNPNAVGGIYKQCSFGATRLDATTSAVVAVSIGCSGTYAGSAGAATPWDITACGSSDYYGWSAAADAAVDPTLLAKYKYRVYIMPEVGS